MVHVQPREASSHHRGQVAAAPEFGLIQAGQGRVAGVAMERTEQGAPVVDQPGERLQSAALAPPAQRERSAEEGRTRVQGAAWLLAAPNSRPKWLAIRGSLSP